MNPSFLSLVVAKQGRLGPLEEEKKKKKAPSNHPGESQAILPETQHCCHSCSACGGPITIMEYHTRNPEYSSPFILFFFF